MVWWAALDGFTHFFCTRPRYTGKLQVSATCCYSGKQKTWVPLLQDFQANGRDSIFTNECALDLCTSIQEFGQRGSLTPSEPCVFLRGLHSCQELCKTQGVCFYLSIFSKVSFSSIPRNATVKSSVGFSGLFQKSYLLRAAYGCEHLFLSLADFLKLH